MKCNWLVLLLLTGFAYSSAEVYAATPLTASLKIDATADVSFGTDTKFDQGIDAWGVLLSALSVDAFATTATATDPGIEVSGAAEATWLSAEAGRVSFSDFGWSYPPINGNASLVSDDGSWKYSFTATQDAYFRIHANIVGEGSDVFGLNGFNFSINGGPEGNQQPSSDDILDAFDPNMTWDFQGHLISGATYTAVLTAQSNISGHGPRTSYLNAQFDWQIVPVPEPGTLLLGISGIGLLAFRRQ